MAVGRVITYGTFDTMHWGHINLLKRAKSLGDTLIVAVSTDRFNQQKGKMSYHGFDERVGFVSAIKYVDQVIAEDSWDQKVQDVIQYDIDIFVMGDDWLGKFDYLTTMCEVIYLPRTEAVSSSVIKSFFK